MKREFRNDAVPPSGKLQAFVTMETAYQHLTGSQSGAEAARLRMLKRMGLDQESGSAAEARERMIRRGEHRDQ